MWKSNGTKPFACAESEKGKEKKTTIWEKEKIIRIIREIKDNFISYLIEINIYNNLSLFRDQLL